MGDTITNISNDLDSLHTLQSIVCSPEIITKYIDSSSGSLTVMHVNIRSLSCNFDALTVLLERMPVLCDVIVLTECWISKLSTIPEILGYQSYVSDYCKQNDGVVIYVKSNISHSIETKTNINDANSLLLRVSNEIAILAIYRSPSYHNIDCFCDGLDTCLASLENVRSVMLIGDININIAQNCTDANCNKYLDLAASHGLMPTHVLPTRIKSCLDRVLLRSNYFSKTFILDCLVTDHTPIFFVLESKLQREHAKTTLRRIDYSSLIKDLSAADFSEVYRANNANTSANAFIHIVSNMISAHSKLIHVPHRLRTLKPWLTPGLVRCI
jgi:predicted kinase